MYRPRKKIVLRSSEVAQPASLGGRYRFTLALLGVFVATLGIGYWLFSPSGASVHPGEKSNTEPLIIHADLGYQYTDGVLRRPFQLGELLDSLRIVEDKQREVFQNNDLSVETRLSAGSGYQLAVRPPQRQSVRELTVELNDSVLLFLKIEPYVDVKHILRGLSERRVAYAGRITETFWQSILESNRVHYSIIPQVEEALKWTVDLFHLGPGDRFKLIYRETVRDERVVEVSAVEAIRIVKNGVTRDVYGVPVEAGSDSLAYVDAQGRGLRRQFLRAPVKFGIVSSAFSPARIHPVTGELRRHGGTDFAAPHGSPIYALADGIIVRRGADAFNGKYVKIEHDAIYQSMYLHMEDFAPTLGRGSRVRQGQVIGYIGSTGLATGPHVCLRFQKNGEEVDFQRYGHDPTETVSLVNPEGLRQLRAQLDTVPYNSILF